MLVRSAAANAQLTINGGNGGDSYNIQQVGAGSQTIVNGGSGDDSFQVAVAQVPTDASVTLHGNAPTDGDHVSLDPSGNSLQPANPNQNQDKVSVFKNGNRISGAVNYDTMSAVAVIAPPVITVGSTFTVAEGGSLQLQATVTSPGFPLSAVTWDLNGDGIFGDAVGASVSVPWTQLVALGLTDDNDGRRLPIAVRASIVRVPAMPPRP